MKLQIHVKQEWDLADGSILGVWWRQDVDAAPGATLDTLERLIKTLEYDEGVLPKLAALIPSEIQWMCLLMRYVSIHEVRLYRSDWAIQQFWEQTESAREGESGEPA
jgi:hypothetical protein